MGILKLKNVSLLLVISNDSGVDEAAQQNQKVT